MTEFLTTTISVLDIDADVIIAGYFSDQQTPYAAAISEGTDDFVGNLMNNGDFDANANEVLTLPYPTGLKANRLVLVGLGEIGRVHV